MAFNDQCAVCDLHTGRKMICTICENWTHSRCFYFIFDNFTMCLLCTYYNFPFSDTSSIELLDLFLSTKKSLLQYVMTFHFALAEPHIHNDYLPLHKYF